ncbi:glycosyltransferase family 4 protein [Rhizobium wuzhouense]|uniref:Glycosyl transferase n=1 Tax=Rhizobium wuzhouense TaxID=1986026 RepID=A0ABX5NLX5_9HYPH|nr:glycosyltransferase family 4 protein [Rhizobium wuzhouense]PYB69777.1 glycosyl transferase [Rhizobium wuzhouense]
MSLSLTFAYPGDLGINTGGYGYDRRVVAGLQTLGWSVTLLPLGDGFPAPSQTVLDTAEARLSALPDNTLVLVDGLAYGVLDGWASYHATRLRIAALVHHPLALETGISRDERLRVAASERKALSFARHVFVTSPMTGRELVENYAVSPTARTVALPGTEPSGLSPRKNEPPVIISVGTLTRRKGHDVLIRALKQVETLPWTARIVGSRTLDTATASALDALIASLDLAERIKLVGEVEDSRAEMMRADIFALASRYEGYGMVFAEALSHGLPIVACATGAVPEVVPENAGVLVPVDDVEAFAGALRQMLTEATTREAKARGSAAAGGRLPTWNDTAAILSRRLQELT